MVGDIWRRKYYYAKRHVPDRSRRTWSFYLPILLTDREQTSASLNSLSTLMIDLMGETEDLLTSTASKRWSAKAIDFLKVCPSQLKMNSPT